MKRNVMFLALFIAAFLFPTVGSVSNADAQPGSRLFIAKSAHVRRGGGAALTDACFSLSLDFRKCYMHDAGKLFS